MDVKKHINTDRKDFDKSSLVEGQVSKDPMQLFEKWLQHAIESPDPSPYACTLSTCRDGKPSSRVVYLRDILDRGLVFYTNYESRKGQELVSNPNAVLNFFWPSLERQVRVEGVVNQLESEISDAYFAARPRESQIGAWASSQSERLKNREELEGLVNHFESKFNGKEIPRPTHWGGYRLKPEYIEFWQGRPSRLHDRLAFELTNENWGLTRLSP